MASEHWVATLVPASWHECKFWQIPFWVLFGNDEDGPMGERSGVTGFQGVAPSLAVFLKWQARNPLHNLWFQTLAVPLWWSVCLIGTPDERNYWPGRKSGLDGVEVEGAGLIIALNPLPYLAFRTTSWEGYFGYRPQKQKSGRRIGAFGIALRHR